MKCIVCVKQVPDTSGVVAVKEDGTMDRAAMDTITNHDDLLLRPRCGSKTPPGARWL